MKHIFSIRVILSIILSLACSSLNLQSASAAHGHAASQSNNLYISLPSSAPGSQVFLLYDYTGNINTRSLTYKNSGGTITLMNPLNCYSSPPDEPITNIWYFTLVPGQTAQLTNYVATPMHFALWVPVDSSSTGQMPATCWFSNWCFGPSTLGAPPNANPAGVTFVEVNLSGTTFDTVDISEVNGVNAAWAISLPGHWSNNSYLDHTGHLIPVATVANKPGAGPNFYGDYGNPGVYPFGCTNCASRYDNQVLRSGCLASESQPPVTYPSFDVGCDNAINYYPNNDPYTITNPPNPQYENPPPGKRALPVDSYAPGGVLFDLQKHKPKNQQQRFFGYGICNILRGSAASGGNINVVLRAYPFGQVQP